MNEEEQKYFKGLIGFTFDSDDIKYIEKVVDKKDKEIERLNNMIKEVRKCIVTHKLYCFKYDNEELFEIVTDKKAKDKLLEILDKGDKEK